MLSTLGAIIKRNARKITDFFKKKTNKPDETNDGQNSEPNE